MKTKDIIIAILFVVFGFLAYYAFGVTFFKDELVIQNPTQVINNPVVESGQKKGKSIINLTNCDFKNYEMDCGIVKYLEENLAWSNNKEGVDFCSYEYLGRSEDNIFLTALCEEFYVSSGELVCPDEETLDKCFVSKDKSECSACTTKVINKHLVEGSGVSIPVRLTVNGGTYNLWTPRDGSLYQKDLKAEFPDSIYSLLLKVKKNLKSINIERAENYFSAKAVFNIKKIFDNSCNYAIDCPEVPGEYAMLSNCPHEMKCIDSKCAVGCYDLIDHEDLPILEK